MSRWTPETDATILRRVGKTGEEAAELLKVICRIVIQGMDGVDPETQKPNWQALAEEVADVLAQCEVTIQALGLDEFAIRARTELKVKQMAEWEALFAPSPGDHPSSSTEDPWSRDDERTFMILMLVGGHDVPSEAITAWSEDQCLQAEQWALTEHVAASDNDDVQRLPMPACVAEHPPKQRVIVGDGVSDLWER